MVYARPASSRAHDPGRIGRQLKKPDEDRAEQKLVQLKGGQQRIRQLNAQKRFILEMRRAIYQMLRLKLTVSGDGTIRAEADVDANVIRLTRDVEEYARRLNEAKWRIEEQQEAGEMSTWKAVQLIEAELRRVRDRFSTTETDMVMAEVAT